MITAVGDADRVINEATGTAGPTRAEMVAEMEAVGERVQQMQLTHGELQSLVDYMTGYDPSAVREGLRFIQHCRERG